MQGMTSPFGATYGGKSPLPGLKMPGAQTATGGSAGGLKIPQPGFAGGGANPSPPGGGYYTGPAGSNVLGNMTYDPATGMVGSAGIAIHPEVDLDQQRRDRDLSDYEKKLSIESRFGGPTVGSTPYGSGGGGGGGGGGAEPPAGNTIDINDIKDLLDDFKPKELPREPNPAAPTRVEAPGAVSLPSAKSQGFARAKDTAGRLGNQALAALRSQMVERGIEGSGVEGVLAGNVLGDVARGTADAAYQQERQAEDQAWDAAKLGYQGNIQQRGQDLGLGSDILGAGVSQRGQDLNQGSQMLSMMPSILNLIGRRY